MEADAHQHQGVHLLLQAAHAVTARCSRFPRDFFKEKRDCRKLYSNVKTSYENMQSSLDSCQSPSLPCAGKLPVSEKTVCPSARCSPRAFAFAVICCLLSRLTWTSASETSSPYLLPAPCKSALSRISPSNIWCTYILIFPFTEWELL